MKKLVVVAVALLAFGTFGVSQAAKGKNADVEQKLTTTEKQLWEAYKNNDMSPFKQNLTDNIVTADQDGIGQGKDKLVAGMSKNHCDMKSYSLSDMK
jgi:hypothetical protein